MKIAIIQMDIAFGDPEANRRYVKQQVEQAVAEETIDLFVLPELWTTGYDLARFDQIAEQSGEITIGFIAKLAKQYQVNFVAGSIANAKETGYYNTLIVIDRQGELIKQYDKVHLFRLMEEEKFLQQGSIDGLFTIDDQQAAAVICYDIRFPEWVRTHMLNGAKVLFVVAEWPKPRIDHWRTLLISRAIENQCYVVACNRIGEDPNNMFGGHSMVIGPWGEIIAEADDQAMTLLANITWEEVDRVRKEIPVYQDRRTELYQSLDGFKKNRQI
ncbi:nitrilase-related carbon-nitrogen hydrolase [Amphibacillus cookii]|uniref:nitrilase-related carbon-nitrogen hydrolase n=1 Tax=Amphibacillus cookii TaxID=767787 RepID=UPI00195A663D|nr:putative amidohydrolase [Amphibacillus cookii]